MEPESKLSLPKFLKVLTSNGVPVPKAMAAAGKIYKEHNTPSKLSELTDPKLVIAGVTDKEDRKAILSAFRKAGYVYKGKPITKETGENKAEISSARTSEASEQPGPSKPVSRPKRKRGQSKDRNEYLPSEAEDAERDDGNFEFNEILNEDILLKKSCVINRAPVMMAWAMVVAERLGFKRPEALSIASVYTEMNAISKGVYLGVFDKGKGKDIADPSGSQPYVDIMGRRMQVYPLIAYANYSLTAPSPLYQTQEGQWRALISGKPIFPSAAFSYITRSFKQTTPHMMGALQLLATSYSPEVLNTRGWSLYADLRPQADGWGKRSEIKCTTILGLRRDQPTFDPSSAIKPKIRVENITDKPVEATSEVNYPEAKKLRMSSDES